MIQTPPIGTTLRKIPLVQVLLLFAFSGCVDSGSLPEDYVPSAAATEAGSSSSGAASVTTAEVRISGLPDASVGADSATPSDSSPSGVSVETGVVDAVSPETSIGSETASPGDSDACEEGEACDADDPCVPDPCLALKRVCLDGVCGDCVEDHVEDLSGFCVLAADPCEPDPCVAVNKVCVNGSCGECLPGYVPQGGLCLAPNPCYPNPCTEPLKTVCQPDGEGGALCGCDEGAYDDGSGGCTYDACVPNPCPPNEQCIHEGGSYICE